MIFWNFFFYFCWLADLSLAIQPAVRPVDEYGALIHAGRWGIHGISLPGRVTFAPGNVGFATFGAPCPMEVWLQHNLI